MTTSAFELYEVFSDESEEPITTFTEPVMTEEDYEEPCEQMWDAEGNPLEDGPCGGKVVSTGGHGYYNGSYDCYTMYLRCDRCGDYEIECV